ncbi:MAG: hypothetical protein AMXMBFR17_01670 [Candidatus Jettenia caeni]
MCECFRKGKRVSVLEKGKIQEGEIYERNSRRGSIKEEKEKRESITPLSL